MIKNPSIGKLGDNSGVSFFQKLVPALVSLALIIGSIFFFFNLVIGAIQWIGSGGDKQSVENARGKITSALVGIAILFAVFALLTLIQNFFNIKILTLDISSLIIR